MLTIDDFWKRHLSVPANKPRRLLAGWKHVESGLSTFLEAPLSSAPGFGDADPEESNIILVSAPGAVGKSTLARQISFETGAILLDLAEADPVGANTLVGGLARINLYQSFQKGDASLIIDSLDEARIRVTQDGFEAFVKDVVDLAEPNRKPIILFGRTGAVQDVWLLLSEKGIEAPVLEIGYYDKNRAVEFTKLQTQNIRGDTQEREPDSRAIELILKQLRDELLYDKDSFSGYAPVLVALAKRVADEPNTQALIVRLEKSQEQVTVVEIVDSILSREQEKLSSLSFQDQTLNNRLYTPCEQIARLVMRLYGEARLPPMPAMSEEDQQTYDRALQNWILEHPFLDGTANHPYGTANHPSSVVFGGFLASKALHQESVADKVLRTQLARGTSTNPFLAQFYISGLSESPSSFSDSSTYIRADHIGIVYASLRARLSLR